MIFFLILKTWRAWNLSFLEIILFIATILEFLYTLAASITLSLGKDLTCSNVEEINTATNPQSCSLFGGAFYKLNADKSREFVRFA
ncbi:hypothetical protein, partial [Salmonella sp. s51228]|uniref:hypothetical protein n=1 Tax=Salmonella sp. s51228 TaxID=3159652 RepID=UPI003981310C